MKIKCLTLTAVVFAFTSIGYAQSKMMTVGPNVVVMNLYAAHKDGMSPFTQTKKRTLIDEYFTDDLADLIWNDIVDPQGKVRKNSVDPLYNVRNTKTTYIEIGQPEYSEGNLNVADVPVTLKNMGKEEPILFHLKQNSDKSWKIDDIRYPNAKSEDKLSLRIILTGTAKTPQKPIVAGSEELKRLRNESASDFAERNGPPNSEWTKVVETVAWGNKKTVIAFYKVDTETNSTIAGYVFMPGPSDTYKKILIDLEQFGGLNPDIQFDAVFFANADKDRAEELVIMGSHGVHSPETMGKNYLTFIFDDIHPGTDPSKLNFLKAVSEKVSGGCDCMDENGKWPKKTYETPAQVKAGLKRLGY